MSRRDFDAVALYTALDMQRAAHGLSWNAVAAEMWEMSAVLNARRADHPISASTLVGMGKRGDTSCQHALVMLRWLERSPESFVAGAEDVPLPAAGPDRRLRWDLSQLYGALDARKRELRMTWSQLARELRCTHSQLTGIRTARYAIGMRLAMRIVGWLGRPAADFVHAAAW